MSVNGLRHRRRNDAPRLTDLQVPLGAVIAIALFIAGAVWPVYDFVTMVFKHEHQIERIKETMGLKVF